MGTEPETTPGEGTASEGSTASTFGAVGCHGRARSGGTGAGADGASATAASSGRTIGKRGSGARGKAWMVPKKMESKPGTERHSLKGRPWNLWNPRGGTPGPKEAGGAFPGATGESAGGCATPCGAAAAPRSAASSSIPLGGTGDGDGAAFPRGDPVADAEPELARRVPVCEELELGDARWRGGREERQWRSMWPEQPHRRHLTGSRQWRTWWSSARQRKQALLVHRGV